MAAVLTAAAMEAGTSPMHILSEHLDTELNVLLAEYDEIEWRDIMRVLAPTLTEAEFQLIWADMQEQRPN